MFDQANPETPNPAIVEQIRRRRPQLVGLSFLSTTSYPYAKMLARQAWVIAANAPGVAADLDPEFVHDLRVASRRGPGAVLLGRPAAAPSAATKRP